LKSGAPLLEGATLLDERVLVAPPVDEEEDARADDVAPDDDDAPDDNDAPDVLVPLASEDNPEVGVLAADEGNVALADVPALLPDEGRKMVREPAPVPPEDVRSSPPSAPPTVHAPSSATSAPSKRFLDGNRGIHTSTSARWNAPFSGT